MISLEDAKRIAEERLSEMCAVSSVGIVFNHEITEEDRKRICVLLQYA